MGWLPFNTVGEIATGFASRAAVRAVEARQARVDVVGAPLAAAARSRAESAGHVLLVAGYAGSELGMQPWLRSLARDGFSASAVAIPGGGLAGVREGVAELERAVAALPAGKRLHLVGHSKGGVVIQDWWRTASAEQRARVETMTLVASTHTGQVLSPFLRAQQAALAPLTGPFSSIIAETQAHDPVMQRIAQLPIADAVRAASVVSERDAMVKVQEAAWRGAHNVVLKGADAPDHMGMLVDPRAYEAVRANVLG
jgi:predicted alpha/beta hydrolase family esterase